MKYFVLKGSSGIHVLRQVYPNEIILEGVETFAKDKAEDALRRANELNAESNRTVIQKPRSVFDG